VKLEDGRPLCLLPFEDLAGKKKTVEL